MVPGRANAPAASATTSKVRYAGSLSSRALPNFLALPTLLKAMASPRPSAKAASRCRKGRRARVRKRMPA
eukprot:9779078-Alexandrium_andersonii.AAC.1